LIVVSIEDVNDSIFDKETSTEPLNVSKLVSDDDKIPDAAVISSI